MFPLLQIQSISYAYSLPRERCAVPTALAPLPRVVPRLTQGCSVLPFAEIVVSLAVGEMERGVGTVEHDDRNCGAIQVGSAS